MKISTIHRLARTMRAFVSFFRAFGPVSACVAHAVMSSTLVYAHDDAVQKVNSVSDTRFIRSTDSVEQRLSETVRALEVDVIDEKEIKNAFLKAMEGSSWKIRFFSFRRFKVDRGLKTSIRMELDTGSSCIRNERWVALLGKPTALNLAQPYGFVDISTPEEVDRHLDGHVVALHYRLDEKNVYSIYSDDESGCFDYLRVN